MMIGERPNDEKKREKMVKINHKERSVQDQKIIRKLRINKEKKIKKRREEDHNQDHQDDQVKITISNRNDSFK
jgi:hypothetical protein